MTGVVEAGSGGAPSAAMITTVGFEWLFAVALGFQALTIALTRVLLQSRPGAMA